LESDFHRLVREHFGEFRAVYPDRYAGKFGFWRPVFDKAVHEFLTCGDLREGFARVRCPDCRHEFFVAFSCKQRCICPSCQQKRTVLLGIHVAEDVCLRVPHRQFVWTIPKRLRIFFRFHRGLLHRLPGLAWQSLVDVYHTVLGEDATPGGILAIQTFGQLIHFHPHLHGLITDGAFTHDGRFIPLPQMSHEPFLRLWEDQVFRLLLDDGKIDSALVAQIRSWGHSGFGVDRSVHIDPGDRPAVERLAQYMARGPFSLARMVRVTPSGQVVYRAEKDGPQRFPEPASENLLNGPARNFQLFDPLDFLAELTQHIPNKGEHLIRYYGWYSNKARGMRARHTVAPAGDGGEVGSPRRADSPAPAPGQPHPAQ
jgi:ribosomal protein S27E